MTRSQISKFVRLLLKATLLVLAVSAPVLALPAIQERDTATIDAPAPKKMGAGFVLMVSLQRA